MARLTVKQMATKDLVPYANNARIHSAEQVDTIAKSIEEFGFNDPVGVWTNTDGQLEIVEGHGRVMAAVDLVGDRRLVLNPKFDQLGIFHKRCAGNGLQIAVDEAGRVIYCCHKPYEVVGDIMDDNILEKKANWKTDISLCDVPCRMTATNEIIEEAMLQRAQKDRGFI